VAIEAKMGEGHLWWPHYDYDFRKLTEERAPQQSRCTYFF